MGNIIRLVRYISIETGLEDEAIIAALLALLNPNHEIKDRLVEMGKILKSYGVRNHEIRNKIILVYGDYLDVKEKCLTELSLYNI